MIVTRQLTINERKELIEGLSQYQMRGMGHIDDLDDIMVVTADYLKGAHIIVCEDEDFKQPGPQQLDTRRILILRRQSISVYAWYGGYLHLQVEVKSLDALSF